MKALIIVNIRPGVVENKDPSEDGVDSILNYLRARLDPKKISFLNESNLVLDVIICQDRIIKKDILQEYKEEDYDEVFLYQLIPLKDEAEVMVYDEFKIDTRINFHKSLDILKIIFVFSNVDGLFEPQML